VSSARFWILTLLPILVRLVGAVRGTSRRHGALPVCSTSFDSKTAKSGGNNF
jgi:hypothetical protein